ncbi:MAG: cyclic nucleotide-binding domain-containing protein, partial [Cyclobacteriaceae bacterium]|nr:cyclic nucleotide-binding domain-containing protein [Cyclobacteriaceae bacterium]
FMVFFKLIHYSYLILGLAGMVIWLAFKLYGEYKETLKKTLLIQKEELRNKGKLNENSVMNLLRAEFSKNKPARILHALRIYEKLDPLGFEFVLLDMLKVKFPTIRQYAYSKLLEHKPFEFLEIVQREIKTEGDDEALRLANEVVNMFTHLASYELNDQSIRELIRSTEAKDRALGACLLSKMTDDKYLAFELELLRDINPHVHIAAIKTAGKLKRPEVWPVLVENLHLASYSNAAVSAICHTGESAFYQVDASFYKTGQYQSTMFRIVQILGRLRSKQSTELLWKKIDFPDKKIISEVLLSLSFTGFQARDFMKSRIQLFIEDMIGDIAWNIKALQDIPVNKSEADQLIRHAFIEENKINYDNIFMLMGMIYDPQSVLLVKENIEAQTVDSVMFAVEMMDVFLDEELKPKIIPVMDDIKDSDRLEKLLNFYPPEEFTSYEDLLKQVINRDYNRISRYTKALALYRLQHFDELSVSFDLIANLFNPDPVLIQTAANTIYNIDKGAYDVNTRRLKVSIKKELDRAILPPVFLEKEDEYFPNLLLIDRILFLKRKKEFSRIPGEIITHMAEVMEEIKVFSGTRLIDVGDAGTIPFYFIIRGEVEVRKNGDEPFTISDGGFFGEELILESECFEYEVIATKTSSLLVLRKEELFDLMSKHIEIMDTFLRILNSENESEEKEEVFDIDIFN